MAVTFPVSSDVEPAREAMPRLDRALAIPRLLGAGERSRDDERFAAPAPRRAVEAYSSSDAPLVSVGPEHALARAAHDAFYGHYPLVLSPDAVWFTIAQGFAKHVALNTETLRARFVRHEGRKKLVVERPDFELGRPNPWPEMFAEFSEQIAAEVGKLRDLVVCDFSTTGPTERAASEVLVMDSFQGYFEYEAHMGCGIPSITLLGTPDDWRSIRTRATMLSELGLEAWIDRLRPVLDQVVRTAEGHVNSAFWRSFFRHESLSGGAELTGWILTLFPYLELFQEPIAGQPSVKRSTFSPYLGGWMQALRTAEKREYLHWGNREGPDLTALPSSLASAPVLLVDVRDDSRHPVRFVGGMFGVTQDPATLALAPEFGWAIVHEPDTAAEWA